MERANQDAKSELGWDELEAQKYLAWMHHLALTFLSQWFITQTKIEWAEQYARDPTMLPQLTSDAARAQVTKHLVNRTRLRSNNLAKAKAQAFLAAMHMHNIVNSVGVAAQKHYWDFDSEVLKDIKTFLKNKEPFNEGRYVKALRELP